MRNEIWEGGRVGAAVAIAVCLVLLYIQNKIDELNKAKVLVAEQAIGDLGALMLRRDEAEQYLLRPSRSAAVIYVQWLSDVVSAMNALEASAETSAKARAAHSEWCRVLAASDEGWYVALSQFAARRAELCRQWSISI